MTESELAERLGIRREEVEALRRSLLSADDFEKKRGGLHLTEEGVEKITRALDLPLPPANGSTEPLALWVVRPARRNPRVILCSQSADLSEPHVSVKVRNSRLFVPGTEIRADHSEGASYRFHGTLPRFRGDRRPLFAA